METLEKYEQLHKLFKELYKEGLLGISDDYLHLREKEFKKLFIDDIADWKLERNADNFETSITKNGTKYIALF